MSNQKTLFKKRTVSSGRKIDEYIPDEAIGYPEVVFEDLLVDEDIKAAIVAARKPRNG